MAEADEGITLDDAVNEVTADITQQPPADSRDVSEPTDDSIGEPVPKKSFETFAVQELCSVSPDEGSTIPANEETVPLRKYLDAMVVPVLLTGLSALADSRPKDPVEFLGNYLLEASRKASSISESMGQ